MRLLLSYVASALMAAMACGWYGCFSTLEQVVAWYLHVQLRFHFPFAYSCPPFASMLQHYPLKAQAVACGSAVPHCLRHHWQHSCVCFLEHAVAALGWHCSYQGLERFVAVLHQFSLPILTYVQSVGDVHLTACALGV